MKIYDTYREMLRHSGLDQYKMLGIREDFIYHNRSFADKEWLKTLPKDYDPRFLKLTFDKDTLQSMVNDEQLVMSEVRCRQAERLPLINFISDGWKMVIIFALLVGASYIFR